MLGREPGRAAALADHGSALPVIGAVGNVGSGSAEPCSAESQGVPLRSPIMDRRYPSSVR